MPTPTEQRALDAIDRDAHLAALSDLIAIPSLGGAESPAQEAMAGLMQSIGMSIDIWPIDIAELSQHPRYATKIERDHALGVVGEFGQGDGPTLVLNGHVDVVPIARLSHWDTPPFQATIDGDRLYGRGSADMKGGLSCALFAVKAIADAGLTLRGRVAIQSVIGEEDGGVGTLATIERGHRGDAAIVLEPTELAVAPAQAGALCYRVEVMGRSAHGALRDEGVNPIEKFIPIYHALLDLERRRNTNVAHPLFRSYDLPYALSVGSLRAGEWDSSVPESLTFDGRIGVAIDEDPADVMRAFEAAIDSAVATDDWLRAHPPALHWIGGQYLPAAIAPDHPIVTATSDAYRDVSGRAPDVRGMRYGADMQLLVHEAGIPTLLFGPGDIRQGHAPNEYTTISELETATRTLVLTILRYCGVADER